MENKTVKILQFENSTTSNFEQAILTHESGDEVMVFYRLRMTFQTPADSCLQYLSLAVIMRQ